MLPFAVRTGLEPATPGVTGRYSNQLNYRTNCSDLCVFVERGCKGRHFFETCKLFSLFFRKKEQKMRKSEKKEAASLDVPAAGLYLTSITLFSSSTFSLVVFGTFI